ncbi:hypothetical protein H9X85_11410 [Anaerotignum lactatifermentans]|uniref:Cell division protein DivIVA n=1 Tax=Anaerotignum lactatifermentans TaxID=160404 RepID=A0ABS2GDW9_9FIRM|nr:hypothetical protein [Anaerotignum lactatifermentans]MBM6830189.1 hypothetical protein [Anaerotignum lactatifermentans]MBM6878738.1 hypothetical protein [Anaerotignum lactatifermentans]MBM6951802.1 hypothetical protein [Anaerotignum lactatifermentans]
MELDKLQKGFFGYKKASVYEYIVSLEEEFSARLSEKDEQLKTNEEKYQSRIRQLESEIRNLQSKYDAQCKEQSVITSTLVEAKRFAEQLKEESQAKEEEARTKFEEELQESYRRLKGYQEQIDSLRSNFAEILHTMDDQLSEVAQAVETTKQECAGRNMSLFERKAE